MYLYFKTELKEKFLNGRTIASVAKEIGVTNAFIVDVLNGKRHCSKISAYCICKCYSPDAEIDDLFIRKEK